MTKLFLQIFLFAISLYGCGSKTPPIPMEKPDLEMEVINDILPELIPEHPPCMPALIEGETHEEYTLRLEESIRKVDPIGKKWEFVSLLTKLDGNYIDRYKRLKNSQMVNIFVNASNVDRRMN